MYAATAPIDKQLRRSTQIRLLNLQWYNDTTLIVEPSAGLSNGTESSFDDLNLKLVISRPISKGQGSMMPNNSLERTGSHRGHTVRAFAVGARAGVQWHQWPAAQFRR